jgi:hypothetical protein
MRPFAFYNAETMLFIMKDDQQSRENPEGNGSDDSEMLPDALLTFVAALRAPEMRSRLQDLNRALGALLEHQSPDDVLGLVELLVLGHQLGKKRRG